MPSPRPTPEDLDEWRLKLYHAHQLEPAIVRRLLAEVDMLRDELARARRTFASKAAAALEKRLQVVAAFNHGGCRTCRDAEARAFLAKLQKIAADSGSSVARTKVPG